MPEQIELIKTWLLSMGMKILFAAAVCCAAIFLRKLLSRAVTRAGKRLFWDAAVVSIFHNIVSALIFLCAALLALDILGVKTASLVTALGAVAVAVGLAFKDSLGNLAGGVILLVSRPFAAGDTIETEGFTGVVLGMDLFRTLLRTFDNRQITIPNVRLVGNPIINYSREENRRLDLNFFVDYSADLASATDILWGLLDQNECVLKTPQSAVGMQACGENSIQLSVMVWCKAADFLKLRFELNEAVKAAFDRANIPFAYRKHHVFSPMEEGGSNKIPPPPKKEE